jgi:hypothetical protein
MKKYASDFVRQIEDQKKNHSADDYVDMMKELKEALDNKISAEEAKLNEEPLDDMSHIR